MEASFNPYDADEICVCGPGAAAIFTIEKNYKAYELTSRPLQTGECVPQMHEWCPGGSGALYVGCAGGEVLVMSSATGEISPNAFQSKVGLFSAAHRLARDIVFGAGGEWEREKRKIDSERSSASCLQHRCGRTCRGCRR